jgi:CDP-paratose 2-epimerase
MSVLITGGLGFIGCNAACRFMGHGEEVLVLDNFSRPGSLQNMEWLRSHGPVKVIGADIRDGRRLRDIFRQHRDITLVLHLAAQVAVTSSVVDPRTDFEINAFGTLNVLEAMRVSGVDASLIYSSTNKVYGQMEDLEIVDTGGRYAYKTLTSGVPETRPLDFHSPYGCSKGAAEQYVRVQAILYLWLSAVWSRGPGVGCLVHDSVCIEATSYNLWRWQAGSRCTVH